MVQLSIIRTSVILLFYYKVSQVLWSVTFDELSSWPVVFINLLSLWPLVYQPFLSSAVAICRLTSCRFDQKSLPRDIFFAAVFSSDDDVIDWPRRDQRGAETSTRTRKRPIGKPWRPSNTFCSSWKMGTLERKREVRGSKKYGNGEKEGGRGRIRVKREVVDTFYWNDYSSMLQKARAFLVNFLT